MKLKLRGKFLLPTIVLVIVGMAIMGYTSYYFAADSLVNAVENEIEQRSNDMAKLISTWMTERKREVLNWSENQIFIDALREDSTAQAARKTATKNLNDLKEKYEFLESLNLADKTGHVVASNSEKAIGIQIGDRGYFTEAMKGNLAISPVLISKLSGNPIFILAAPVKVGKGVGGVVFVVVDLGLFNQVFIDPLKIGEKGYAYMFDREGRLIAYPPDKTQLMKLNISEYEFGKKMLAEGNGMITYTFNGQERLAAFRHNEYTGWTVGMAAITDEVYAPARRLGYINLILSVVVAAGIGLAMLILVSWVVTRPLGRVVGIIRKISGGNLRERVDIKSHDELGQLSSALDGFIVSLSDLTELLVSIGQGDLTNDIPRMSDEDQIAPAAQAMLDNLRDIVGRVESSSAFIANGSAQVSDSSQALSQGATEQAASLEEITSSMTELGGQTATNAENAAQANQLARNALSSAEKGNQQMDGMIGAMKDINDSSKEIAKIIKAIDDIAFQTNLLALNAAVEAARAGKHGKGFAVVAQEVRNLAGRSAKAARETAELIDGAVKKVDNGTEILNRTASALSEIKEGSTKVTDLVGEIAAASNEQAQGISQINQGLSQVELVTQQNTANAEQTASAAVELSNQAAELRKILSRFSLKEEQAPHPTQQLGYRPEPRTGVPAADSESLFWGEEEADITRSR